MTTYDADLERSRERWENDTGREPPEAPAIAYARNGDAHEALEALFMSPPRSDLAWHVAEGLAEAVEFDGTISPALYAAVGYTPGETINLAAKSSALFRILMRRQRGSEAAAHVLLGKLMASCRESPELSKAVCGIIMEQVR